MQYIYDYGPTNTSLIAITYIRYLELTQQQLQTKLQAADAEVARLRKVSDAIMLDGTTDALGMIDTLDARDARDAITATVATSPAVAVAAATYPAVAVAAATYPAVAVAAAAHPAVAVAADTSPAAAVAAAATSTTTPTAATAVATTSSVAADGATAVVELTAGSAVDSFTNGGLSFADFVSPFFGAGSASSWGADVMQYYHD